LEYESAVELERLEAEAATRMVDEATMRDKFKLKP
jgi:hypothetical protein